MRLSAGATRRILLVLASAIGLAGCGGSGPSQVWPPQDEVARPEHPRPDFARDSFINLNTVWDFAYDPEDVGLEQAWFEGDRDWDERIQLPYAWEAPLSGLVPPHEGPYQVGETMLAPTYRGVAWYRLRFPEPLPERRGMDWTLVFGAVDFAATVWIDGTLAAEHTGGYTPFSVNLAPYLERGRPPSIVVRVEDYTELNDLSQPVGKQGGLWYTRTSGIWQTVYLEQRPAVHLEALQIVPDPDAGRVLVRPSLNEASPASLRLEARLDGERAGAVQVQLTGAGDPEVILDLTPARRWDADDPVVYELDATLVGPDGVPDVVHTFFGLVEVRTDWLPGRSPSEEPDPGRQAKAVFINDRPRYLRCVLDQSYYPDGIYTAPSIERIRRDLETTKAFGFDCIRLHVKVDEPVKLRLADELGLYVLYDVPTLDLAADNVSGFAGRGHVEALIRRAVARDRNHPSVLAWVVFNENWGLMEQGSLLEPQPLADSPDIQAWVREMVALARELDPHRPVEDNSAGGIVGRYEHLDTDLNSFHYYGQDPAAFRAHLEQQAELTFPGSAENFVGGALQDGDPWFNSEFASFSAVGQGDAQAYCDLFWMFNELRRTPRLSGYVLTELTDVEFETNGLLTYDREAKDDLCTRAGVGIADLTGADFVGFDWLPGQVLPAGASVEVPLFVSCWSETDPQALTVVASFSGSANQASTGLSSVPYEPAPLTVELTAPAEPGPADLVVELQDPSGRRLAANRLPVIVE